MGALIILNDPLQVAYLSNSSGFLFHENETYTEAGNNRPALDLACSAIATQIGKLSGVFNPHHYFDLIGVNVRLAIQRLKLCVGSAWSRPLLLGVDLWVAEARKPKVRF